MSHQPSPTIRIISAMLAIAGIIITVLAVFADRFSGLSGGGEGLGWKQLIGAIIGIVMALVGVGWMLMPPTARR